MADLGSSPDPIAITTEPGENLMWVEAVLRPDQLDLIRQIVREELDRAAGE